jgi:PAS domain S-box-containing protein
VTSSDRRSPPKELENELRKLEEESKLRQRYLESVLELSPVAIVITDKNANVTTWNPAAERLFWYTREEALGRNLDDLVATTPEMHAEGVSFSRQASRKGLVKAVTRRTRKDGSLVDVELLAAPLIVDNEVVGTYGVYLDISELHRQKEYYESLLQVSPSAIITVDTDDVVTSWNAASERLLGYTRDEAIGRNIDGLVAKDPEVRAEAESVSARVAEDQVQLTTRRTRKDGSMVDVAVVGAPIKVGGELVGKYVFYHDIGEIQRQRRYFEALLEGSPVAVATVNEDAVVTSWNPAAERLFGYSPEEAIGRGIDDLVANRADIRKEAEEITRRGLSGETVRSIGRRTRKDGSLVDVEMVGVPVTVGGEAAGYYCMWHDISELRRQTEYYESLLRVSPTAVMTVDPDDRVTSWNPAAERILGYSAEEAIGRPIDELVARSPEIREEAAQVSARVGTDSVQLITRRTRKDGTLVDVAITAAPIVVAGELVGKYAIYHDISDLQRQRRYFESLLEISPVAVVTTGLDASVTSWNPAAEKLFGYTAEEAIGQNLERLVANRPELYAEAVAINPAARESGRVQTIVRRVRKDGSLVDVELVVVPVVLEGEIIGNYAIYHDITELLQARQQAEAATEAKSAFLATMSHEIRTPLNAIIGMTGLLLDTELSPEQSDYAEVARSSGDALLAIINDILDFSKIEAGRLDLEEQPLDLRECIESALELVAPRAGQKGLELAYLLGPDVPEAIVGDLTRLRQVFTNLLSNAVKFTEAGEVVLSAEAEFLAHQVPRDPDGIGDRYRLRFSVRDTGIGIPDDRLDRLFESFTQADTSTSRRYGGTGLGLAISRRLAELMGGKLWAESEVGRGSTFHVTIEANSAPPPNRVAEAQAGQLEGKRILIVDDNATNRHILRRQAESWRMLPRDTKSPVEALGWIERGDPFDVAVLDRQMPEMDGLALAREIRRRRDGRNLPLVMLTSLGRREDEEEGVDLAAHLTKPVKPSQLYNTLLDVFGMRAELPVSEPTEEIEGTLGQRRPLRILVAEDNATNQKLALLLLQKIGYRADVVGNGLEAVEALERAPYDVVLMDVQMPEMDGLEATRLIHRRWPGDDRPYIVAATANATREERENCLAAGMDDYLSKPIRLDGLAGALKRARPPASRRAAPAVDQDTLGALRESLGGPEALADLLGTFLEEAPRSLASLDSALQIDDLGEVRRLAHSLKSNAATFGAMALSELARELEAAAKEEDGPLVAKLVPGLKEEYARVRAELEAARDG